MIKILFFAQVRELIGVSEIEWQASPELTAEIIRQQLCERGGKWQLALENGKLLVAINQAIVPLNTVVKEGDEVAFFPPVTGG